MYRFFRSNRISDLERFDLGFAENEKLCINDQCVFGIFGPENYRKVAIIFQNLEGAANSRHILFLFFSTCRPKGATVP